MIDSVSVKKTSHLILITFMLFRFKIIYFIVVLFPFFSGYTQDLFINEIKTDSLVVNEYLKLSRENEQNNPSKSFDILDKIEEYSNKNNYKKGIYTAKKERAYIYHIQQKYDSAISEIQKINIQVLQLNATEKARFYNLKGIFFQAKEVVDSSLYYLNKSLSEYRKIENAEGIISSLVNIGIPLYQAGLQEEALKSFEEAYNLSIQLKHFKSLPTVINNYAALLIENGEIKKAEKLFKSLLDSNNLDTDNSLKATLLLNWGSLQKIRGNTKKATEWYQKAIDFSKSKNLPVLPNSYIGLGQIYLFENKPSKALLEFHKSLSLNLIYSERKMIYKSVSDAHLKLKNQDSAAFYWEKLSHLTEEKYKEKMQNAIAEAQKNVTNYKKDFEIQLLTKDNKILAQKNRANKFTILSLVLVGLLALSIIYWYKKQQKLKNKQFVKEMKLKKQALVSYALKITQKNQLLYNLKENLSKIELKETNDLKVLQKEVTATITHSVHNDKDWEQFEVYFNDIYQGFYERLKQQFPDLTDNDLRICTLVKLRFTLKEISNLLFSSVETIKSTRYRIRKKLNLQQEQNLSDFLNKV